MAESTERRDREWYRNARKIALKLWDTCSVTEIAATLGLPVSTVGSWGHRAGKGKKRRGRPRNSPPSTT